ncbi:MAG: purine-nucleoside phosphorylase [Dehalococcoidia bacterium]|nr:purine-nucleoside phosphorylase [Dehalococcoidia bacterium]
MSPSSSQGQVEEAAAVLSAIIGVTPSVAVILGSGLGGLADEIAGAVAVPFERIPHFPTTTVVGHDGVLVFGELAGKIVVMMRGRPHFYEGYGQKQVTFPIRVLAALGVHTLLVTNAVGGINDGFTAGDIMVMTDHINLPGLAGLNPLRGWPEETGRSRFLSLHDAYDPPLRALALATANDLGLSLQQGVYAMVAGPSYETPAEVRFLREIGADAVGMSTVSEVIVARHCGMRVLGLSCIANQATASDAGISHDDVLSVADVTGPRLAALIKGIVARL